MRSLRLILLLVAATVAAASPASAFDLRAAIASAEPGATIRIPAGRYDGTITVDKPLTLLADGEVVIEGVGEGDVVRITAPDVTLRGLVIRRTGDSLDRENAGILATAPRTTIDDCTLEDVLFGVYFKNAPNSVLRNSRLGSKPLDVARRGDVVKIWYSDGTIVEGNTIRDGRDLVMWYSRDLVIRGNHISNCRYGVHFMFAGHATVEDNTLLDNSVGIFLMYGEGLKLNRNVIARNRGPSGYGLGLKDVDFVEINDNLLIDNRVGLHIDNSPSRMDVRHRYERNVFAYNDIALGLMPNDKNNDFVDNAFFDNVEQVSVFGSHHEPRDNQFTVDGRGNYWSDYRGYDLDGDGVGDVPYRAASLFENLVDRQPKLRLFLFSPATQAIELASRAFPIVKPNIRAIDTAPRMHPPRPAILAPAAGWSWSMASAALALLALGGWVLFAGVRPIGASAPKHKVRP